MIAFLIMAHNDPDHVARLVSKLRPHRVFIHLDIKSNFNQKWQEIEASFVQNRVPVYWGDFSQIEASITLIQAALSSGETYSKLVLLSGSCYPIRPLAQLESMFESDGGYNYIGRIPVDASSDLQWMTERKFHCGGFLPWRWISKSAMARLIDRGLRRVYFETISKIPRPWTGKFSRFHGSQWWAITPDCARYVVDRSKDKDTVSLYRTAMVPDEQFFHSIIADSSFRKNSGPDVEFIGVGAHVAANLHIIDPALKKWFSIDDFDEIATSEKFFVRKVSTVTSTALLDKIDELIAGSENDEIG